MKKLLQFKSLLQVILLLILVICGTLSFGQDRTINGKVTANEDGTALPGVTVLVKGSTIGSQTSASGNFTIRFPSGSTELEFSYLGYVTQTVPVGAVNTVNVSMIADAKLLGEVVVTALGITRETKSLTYAAQGIKADALNKTTGVNMANALQGKVAGAVITRSTGVGAGASILLRGNRSINGTNAPLIITDGVPGSIGLGDGDNIESMTVLKGAAAAALYGSQGQNGVVIITTKKGAAGKTSIEFNGGTVFDVADILLKSQSVYGQGDAGLYVASSERSWGPKMTGQPVVLWNGHTVPYSPQPGRINDFYRTGVTLNNSLAINSGTEKMQTYISYSNITAQGIQPDNDLTRHTVNVRIANNLTKKLSIDSKITYRFQESNNTANNESAWRAPVSIPLSEMKQYLTDAIDPVTGNPKQSYWKPGSSILGNPYWYIYRNPTDNKSHQVVALLSAKYTINNWMSLQVRGNLNQSFSNGWSQIYANSYASLVGSTMSTSGSNGLGSNADALLTFKHDLSKSFNLSGNIGAYASGSKSSSVNTNANGFNKPDFFYMSNAKAPTVQSTDTKSVLIQSLYSTFTLAYKNYLYLDVTGRNDWSSALPKGHYGIFYPSAGLTAVVSDMTKMPSWISYGKVRANVAQSGSGGSAYLSQQYFSVGTGGAITTPTTLIPGNYQPELTTSYEGGLEWKFFKNRLGFDVTYYKTETTNQLLLVGTPPATLYATKYLNAGLVRNTGLEATINATPLQMGKFSWNTTINYAKNKNLVVRITPSQPSVLISDNQSATIKVEEGKPFATMYVKAWQRDAQGRKLVDALGRPLLTSNKPLYIGVATPDYTASMSNGFSYSNLSLSVQIDYRHGGRIIGFTQALMDADGSSLASLGGRETGIIIDGYTAAGVKNTLPISAQNYYGALGDRYPTGEDYNYSGTNMRVREVALDYKVPSKFISKIKVVKAAKLSFTGRNLFFIQRSTPFDPDLAANTGGQEAQGALPFSRSYGLNLQVTF